MSATSSLAGSKTAARSRTQALIAALRTDRAALWVHVASLLIGGAFLFYLDRHRWFLWDEWVFFARLHPQLVAGDWKDFLFAPYVSHWVTIPNLLFEAAYRIGGTHHYWVYLVAPLSAHLGVVALVRVVMRRVGVGAWLATFLSLPLLLTGAGAGNLVFGWQIQFVGAVLFGLSQLVISDHDGPVDWRDFAGVILGLLGLMCSAVSLAMVPMVGLNLALRSRWRAAAIAILPLGAIFIAWYEWIGHRDSYLLPFHLLALLPQFIWTGVAATFDGLTGIGGVAPLVLIGSIILAVRLGLLPRRPGYSLPWAMGAGGIVLFFLAGYGRIGAGVNYATGSRYVYVALACFLPLVAMVIARYVDTTPMRWVLAGFLAWAMVANLSGLYQEVRLQTDRSNAIRDRVLALANDPALDSVDSSTPIDLVGAMELTVGVVQRMHRNGDIP